MYPNPLPPRWAPAFLRFLVLAALACGLLALITSCGPAPLGRLNPGALIGYDIVTDADMYAARTAGPTTVQLQWGTYATGLCATDRILEMHAGACGWTAVHECAHLADRLGSYRQAIFALTPPGVPNEHMAQRLALMEWVDTQARKRGTTHWQVIYDRWGAEAVGHPDILAKLKRDWQ